MLLNAFRMEWTKVLRRRMTWVLVAILVLLLVGMYAAIYSAGQADLSDPSTSPETVEMVRRMLCWPQALTTLLGFVGGTGMGGLMLIVLTGTMVAQEYSWRTTHLWLSRGLPRRAFLLGKYAALVVVALGMVLAAVLVGASLTAWFTRQLTGALDLAGLSAAEVGLSILRTTFTILPYAGLTFLVAILTRSTAAAIAVGLSYALVVENLIMQLLTLAGGLWADIARYAPGNLAEALLQTNLRLVDFEVGGASAVGSVDPWVAAGGMTLYVTAALGLSIWTFRRQNLTG